MFIKISAFIITWYIFSTVSAKPPKELGQTANISEDQFTAFAGQTDPCDSTDTNFLKQICDKVAIKMNYIKSGSMNYYDGFPKCIGYKVELQKGNGQRGGTAQVQTLLLYCNAKEWQCLLGRGQSANGVYGWSYTDSLAYPQEDVPDVFKGPNQVA